MAYCNILQYCGQEPTEVDFPDYHLKKDQKKNLSRSLMRQLQLQWFYLVRKRNKSLSLEVG